MPRHPRLISAHLPRPISIGLGVMAGRAGTQRGNKSAASKTKKDMTFKHQNILGN